MKPFLRKLLVGANYSVGLLIAIIYTLRIDISSIDPHFADWLLLLILLVFTSGLIGTPLWLITGIVIALCSKDSKVIMDHKSLEVSQSSFIAVGVATAYTMILYFIGLTNSFFSFMVFYT